MNLKTKKLKLGPYEFESRLFVGTGKYETFELMAEALEASGCEVVTVAVRRERLLDDAERNILDFLDRDRTGWASSVIFTLPLWQAYRVYHSSTSFPKSWSIAPLCA